MLHHGIEDTIARLQQVIRSIGAAPSYIVYYDGVAFWLHGEDIADQWAGETGDEVEANLRRALPFPPGTLRSLQEKP